MGASSDKQQQNQAADSQIQQHKDTALASLAQYLAQNPGPLAGAQPPAPPPQYTGQAQGQHFGPGPQGSPPPDALRQALMMQRPQMQGTPFQNAPQPGGPQMPGQPPPPQAPPGLLGLLHQ